VRDRARKQTLSTTHRHPDVELAPPRLSQLKGRLLHRAHVVLERGMQRERHRAQHVRQVPPLGAAHVGGPAVRLELAGFFAQVKSDGARGHRDDELGVFQAGGAGDVLGLLHLGFWGFWGLSRVAFAAASGGGGAPLGGGRRLSASSCCCL
jgi:hypothetical protein